MIEIKKEVKGNEYLIYKNGKKIGEITKEYSGPIGYTKYIGHSPGGWKWIVNIEDGNHRAFETLQCLSDAKGYVRSLFPPWVTVK